MRAEEYDERVRLGIYRKKGRPCGHIPANKGLNARRREPVKSRLPIVRDLFEVIDNDPRSLEEVAHVSGYHWASFSRWRRGYSTMNIADFVNVAETMRKKVILVDMED